MKLVPLGIKDHNYLLINSFVETSIGFKESAKSWEIEVASFGVKKLEPYFTQRLSVVK